MADSLDTGAAILLAQDVLELEAQLSRTRHQLEIVRAMMLEALDIAHQAIAHIAAQS